jgi:hypothetical protein
VGTVTGWQADWMSKSLHESVSCLLSYLRILIVRYIAIFFVKVAT